MASAANMQPPDALKALRPYMTLATQLDQRDERVIAYYCRLFSVQQGMQINRSAPECKKFLAQLMDILENTKKHNPSEEAIMSDVVGQAFVEKYALKIFEKADDEDRQANFNKNLVKQFYSAGLLFDVLNCFGDLSEDLIVKKQYAKRKAMYLNKCFQTGETPIPGPLIGDGFDEELGGGGGGGSGPSGGSQAQNYPRPSDYSNTNEGYGASSQYKQEPIDRPASSSNKKPTSPSHEKYPDAYHDQTNAPNAEASFPPELMQKAQKFCKFASSALQYDDVNTAISNLEQCLAVLKTGKR